MYKAEYRTYEDTRQALFQESLTTSAILPGGDSRAPEPQLQTIDGVYRLSKRASELKSRVCLAYNDQVCARWPWPADEYRDEIVLSDGSKLTITIERGIVRLAMTYTPISALSRFPRLRSRAEIRRIVRAYSKAGPSQKFRLRGEEFNAGLIAVLAPRMDVRDGLLRIDFEHGRWRTILWLSAEEAHICIAPCPLLDVPPAGPLFGEGAA